MKRYLIIGISALIVIFGSAHFYFSYFSSSNVANLGTSAPSLTITQSPSSTSPTFSKVNPHTYIISVGVKIALLDPGHKYPVYKTRGCDNIVLVKRTIASTMQPLAGAIKDLLGFKQIWSGNNDLYNYIAQGTLALDHVDLKNGVASVYLRGRVPILGGVCDDPRLQIQIEETAFQFRTVTSVKIFLDGALYVPPNERG